MDPTDTRIEQRLVDLEVKATYTEDLLDRLNDVIVRQQNQIDLLLQEVARLEQQSVSAQTATFRTLREELPPHY
jgi:SlyX protein